MEQVHFRGKVRIIRKGAERVEDGMDDDAGKQAAAAIKDRDQQEADCDGKANLAQVTHKIHTKRVPASIIKMPAATSNPTAFPFMPFHQFSKNAVPHPL